MLNLLTGIILPEQVDDVIIALTSFTHQMFSAAIKKVHKCSGYYVQAIEEQEALDAMSMDEIFGNQKQLNSATDEPLILDPETSDFMDQLIAICSTVTQSVSDSTVIQIEYEVLSYPAIQFLADVYGIKPPRKSKEILIQHLRESNISVREEDIINYLSTK